MSGYVPHTEADLAAMLSLIGVASTDQLFRASLPEALLDSDGMELGAGLSEQKLAQAFGDWAAKGTEVSPSRSFLGAGMYHHYRPALIGQLAGRGEFLTAYTPYQPEVSQGTLQAIFEFQTMASELCGLPIANASMYDGASALAEAVLMTERLARRRRRRRPPRRPPRNQRAKSCRAG